MCGRGSKGRANFEYRTNTRGMHETSCFIGFGDGYGMFSSPVNRRRITENGYEECFDRGAEESVAKLSYRPVNREPGERNIVGFLRLGLDWHVRPARLIAEFERGKILCSVRGRESHGEYRLLVFVDIADFQVHTLAIS